MKKLLFLGIFVLAFLLFGCKGQEAFRVENYQVNPYGSYAEARFGFYGNVSGEMLYIKGDTLAILTKKEIEKVDLKDVKKIEVRVAATISNGSVTSAWSLVNFIWSFAHGFFSAIMVPANVLGGLITGPVRYYEIRYPETVNKQELSLYCRFPQGLPPDCVESTLTYPSTF